MRVPDPSWTALRRLGGSRVLASATVWFWLIPLAARLLEASHPVLQSILPADTPPLTLTLPFSWQLLFFVSLSFAAGTLVYAVGCPRIIYHFGSVQSFVSEGRGERDLGLLYLDVWRPRKRADQLRSDDTQEFLAILDPEVVPTFLHGPTEGSGDRRSLREALMTISPGKGSIPDAFWFVVSVADLSRPPIRYLCTGCYAVGFLLFALLVGQNVTTVCCSQ